MRKIAILFIFLLFLNYLNAKNNNKKIMKVFYYFIKKLKISMIMSIKIHIKIVKNKFVD